MLWRRSIRCGSNYGWPNRPDTSSPACLDPPTRSTSSSTTPATVCTPATPSRFRPGNAAPVNFEVYHQPLFDNNDPTDLWVFNDLGTGKSLTNQAYNRVLHASATQVTPPGHKYLYTCAPSNGDHAEEFTIAPVPGSGYGPRQSAGPVRVHRLLQPRQRADRLRWRSIGLDLTPGGRATGPPGASWFQPLLLLSFLGVVEHCVSHRCHRR